MRKTGKMMAAFLTALITPALAYTAVCAPFSVYAAAQETLGISDEADSPESGGGGGEASVATAATPTNGDFVSGEPFAALAVTPLAIERQPANLHVEPGAEAKFSVEVVGDVASYKWQASNPGYGDADWPDDPNTCWPDVRDTWVDIDDDGTVISTTTSSLLTITSANIEEWDNTGFRCVVTDGHGGEVISEIGILAVYGRGYPEITSVLGKPIGPNYTMGMARTPDYAIDISVTVPNDVLRISVDDIEWESDAISPPVIDSLYSSKETALSHDSPTEVLILNPGSNAVYFCILYNSEATIYYHISITRESASSGISEPSGGSSEPGGGNGSDPLTDTTPGSSGDSGTDRDNDGDPDRNPPPIQATEATMPDLPQPGGGKPNVNANPSTGGGDIPDAPETGDKSNAALWIIMLISPVLASSGLIAVYMGRRGSKG